jgi:RNA polymerase sigma-B factor
MPLVLLRTDMFTPHSGCSWIGIGRCEVYPSRQVAAPHNPSAEAEGALFSAWVGSRDERARDELVRRYLPLAHKLALRYARSGEPYDDLLQVASVGLIKAVQRFDPEHGVAFASYAVPTILGELKRHFRDTSWSFRVDRRSQELARRVLAAQRALQAAGSVPTVAAVAEHLHLDAEVVLEGLQASLAYSAVSLDAPSGAEDGELQASLGDTVGVADRRLEGAEDRATLGAAVRHLPKLERQILFLRYGQDLTQREIAARVGISQMHVSRLLRRALGRLENELVAEPSEDPVPASQAAPRSTARDPGTERRSPRAPSSRSTARMRSPRS